MTHVVKEQIKPLKFMQFFFFYLYHNYIPGLEWVVWHVNTFGVVKYLLVSLYEIDLNFAHVL